jgi:hypothetical protein
VNDLYALMATFVRAGLLAVLRPDKYVRILSAVRREGMSATTGFAIAAVRCPHRPGLIDELVWRSP